MQGNILVIKSKGWTRFAKVPSSSKILWPWLKKKKITPGGSSAFVSHSEFSLSLDRNAWLNQHLLAQILLIHYIKPWLSCFHLRILWQSCEISQGKAVMNHHWV
jgi:hypothetical protein